VVNLPVPGAVPPIAGGDARYVLNPVPLTVLLAASVVNEPVLPLMGLFVMPSTIVTTPVERVITNGLSMLAPASLLRVIWKFEPTFEPLFVALLRIMPHIVTPPVCKYRSAVFAFTALTVSVPSPEAGETETAPENVAPVSEAEFE
jgi:hypothetical protein